MAESILACSACLRRAIQSLPKQNAILERRLVQQALYSNPAIHISRRFASTTTPATIDSPKNTDEEIARKIQNFTEQGPQGAQLVDPEDSEAQKKVRQKLDRAVNKQLQYNDDPWKIGQLVELHLKKDRYDEALLTTQTASKRHQVVVSWNHLINYKLENQELKAAVKLYNDMKKRAQLPNVQTYTIMFRGMAKSQHPKLAVAEAVKHYNILMRDSRLQPNSTHMNAVINVCGRAGDLDSMFTILDSVNETTRLPTSYTYTSILNALRYTTQNEIKDLDQEQKNQNLEKMVYRAKALWEEVIDKWRKGRLAIDEELICAMGRLLASSGKEHQREVLDLIEQTMNIPNVSKSDVQIQTADSKATVPAKAQGIYAKPSRNTLALVLTVVTKNRLTTAGIKYWNILVREHGIVPDLDNWMRLFGMLSVAKASAHASEILALIPDEYINYKFYRMAMTTCIRDNINPNAIKNSNVVLESMLKRLEFPDPHALRLYLRVAMVSHYDHRAKAKSGDDDGAKRAYGTQIINALAKLWGPYRKLHAHYFKDVEPRTKVEEQLSYNNKREVIALARIMYSSFSKVIEERMLPDEEVAELRQVGGRINKEIQKFYKNREDVEPKLNAKTKATHDMSEFDYKPMGDFVWDTTKKDEPLSATRDERDRQRGIAFGEKVFEPRERSSQGLIGRERRAREGRERQGSGDHSTPWPRGREQRSRRQFDDADSPRALRNRYAREDGERSWSERRERPRKMTREW